MSYKLLLKNSLVFFFLSIAAFAQTPQILNNVQQLNWTSSALPAVTNANGFVHGQQGTATYYYWVIANFTAGNASPYGPVIVYNAPNVLDGVNNYVVFGWTQVVGATNYTILRTNTPNLPLGPATDLLSIATPSSFTLFDIGTALSSYTVNTFNPTSSNCNWSISNNSINAPCLSVSAGVPLTCVGSPGNTIGTYKQQCVVTGTGALFGCNNAAGCNVAADWIAIGSGSSSGASGTPQSSNGSGGFIPTTNSAIAPLEGLNQNTIYTSDSRCAGATNDALITNCAAVLGASGGTIDARSSVGNWTNCPNLGSAPLQLIVAPGTTVLNNTIQGTCAFGNNVNLLMGPSSQLAMTILGTTTGTTTATESGTISLASTTNVVTGSGLLITGGVGSANKFATYVTGACTTTCPVAPVIPTIVTNATVLVTNVLKVNGPISAPFPSVQQQFSGIQGSLIINNQAVWSNWCGTDPTNTNSSVLPYLMCANALYTNGGQLLTTSGKYKFDSTTFIDQRITNIGQGANNTTFSCTAQVPCFPVAYDYLYPSNTANGGFERIGFIGPSTGGTDNNIGIVTGGDQNNVFSPQAWYSQNYHQDDTIMSNFTTAYTSARNNYLTHIRRGIFNYNYNNVLDSNQYSNSGEEIIIEDSVLSLATYPINSSATSNTEWRLINNSFDFNTQPLSFGSGPSDLFLSGDHFEWGYNGPVISSQGAVRLTSVGSNFLNDIATGSSTSIVHIGSPSNGSWINFVGGFAYSASPVTQFLLLDTTGGSRITMNGFQISSSSNIGPFTNDITDYCENIGTKLTCNTAFFNATSTASLPALTLGGSWFTGGTATTTRPHFTLECNVGTTVSTGWQTTGTGFGINACSGFAGYLQDWQINGVSKAHIASSGGFISSGGGVFGGVLTGTNVLATSGYVSTTTLFSGSIGGVIASATTIAPLNQVQHISGTLPIVNITLPTPMNASLGGCLQFIADGAWTTTTAGNIATTLTATAGTEYNACYDGTKWYIK